MNQQKFHVQIGSKLIADMLNPEPHELDMDAIEANLKGMLRFANHPKALTVWEHKELVVRLVELDKKDGFEDTQEGHDLWLKVRQWAGHHDDHEGVIGDIIAPVKAMILSKTNILEIAEVQIDKTICVVRGIEYPSELVSGLVRRYDKAAETIEWVHALGKTLQDFNHPCPQHLFEQGHMLIQWARGRGS